MRVECVLVCAIVPALQSVIVIVIVCVRLCSCCQQTQFPTANQLCVARVPPAQENGLVKIRDNMTAIDCHYG